MGVIGDTLSEARIRRGVDLEQIEAATGVRTRYLRAIEAEDWSALPEEFYARSFVRKYAQYVGVAPEPLVEEYRRQRGTAGHGAAPTSPFATTTSQRAEALRRRRRRQGIYAWLITGVLVAAVVVAIVLLSSGGGSTSAGPRKPVVAAKPRQHHPQAKPRQKTSMKPPRRTTVELRVEPTAEVWACVENATGKPLLDGVTLTAGKAVGPFDSRSFTVAFGNGSVALWVDGKRAPTPSSPDPIGLTIEPGKVHQLPEGKRPTCE